MIAPIPMFNIKYHAMHKVQLLAGASKSISGCFTHQAGIFGVKCFSTFCVSILADSKSVEILMPNDGSDLKTYLLMRW